jgi:hypothetical protein
MYDGPWLANGDLKRARGLKLDRWRCDGKRGEDQNKKKWAERKYLGTTAG